MCFFSNGQAVSQNDFGAKHVPTHDENSDAFVLLASGYVSDGPAYEPRPLEFNLVHRQKQTHMHG